ncbi:S-layer homology domain-containing protein [Solibacillus sp. FSL H8-0523]|uniref:S-layer homology domain-containing protein n=1 Tax=Solibacillus sp. FSL H8-0523 TaxID=2954511 RepID=UPI0031017303
MESKRAQKLSKATVATILAASGVIVAIPQPSHAYSFKDINPLSDYYEPILDLASRKIVTGYSDGTFKPNQSITREDAAKMLALTIDINIKNPKKPGFKDVPMNSPNYRYIAALAEAGIINGYPDKTFKPKEPITRGQMAKILTLGFEFGVSTKLNHGFKDVSSKDGYAYFIQTLYDLNITKGKTAISYDPLNSVTRAQMATFIWRAEKADRGNPVYTVGDIIGNQIYINGVAHTIAPHLRSILSAANKNILKDATIEGDFSGNRINNISRLTINASGTSSRLLAMDGEYSSFAGELVVNGSYVRFKNITFTGRVELAEAPRRSLANLSNVRVASVGNVAQFIDWSKPTVDKNEDFLNPIDKENLVDKPDPTKPNKTYKDRMPNLKKYVDFEGSDVRHLYVTADHAFLKADYDIDRLYVQGNVANFELYASPNAMYIDTDYNVNIYGVHDIRYVYKNTLKNVHLRSDATYDNYYITSSNGFTNISDHTYITDAIIPPNKTVNDVFDDFETDEPQIGHIEDTNGKPVSRDPVGDTVIKDVTSPRITDLTVSAGGTIADVSLIADEDGTYYYVVKQADEKAPSINEIKTGGTKHAGKGPIVMDEPAKFQIVGLDTKTDYVIYAIVIDAADNVSEKESTEFSTIDNRPPTLLLKPTTPQPAGGKRLEFTFEKVSEPGTIYYYIREGSSGNPPEMSVDDVIKNATATITATKPGDIIETSRIHGSKPNLAAIEPNRTYYVYAVMVDSTGNKMTVVENKTIKSAMPDEAQPFVADSAQLRVVDKDKGIFEFTASEELDKTTAENVDNYTLTGTAVLNITGQKTIKPSKVEVNKNKVRFTIPALNSLVKGDTIRVTVSKDVLDLAENEFEHTDRYPEDQNAPRNEAYYTHSDDTLPTIKINKVVVEKDRNLVEFEAPTKAGTYYYMIMESGFDFAGKGITARDFLDEFEPQNLTKPTKFNESTGGKAYIGNLLNQSGPAELGVNTQSIKIDFDKLNPFKSYSVYMILKDRAGLVSTQIVGAPIVSDSKAPLIYGLEVGATNGLNNSVEFKFTADEPGELSVIAVRKYLFDTTTNSYRLNTQFFNADGTLKEIPQVYPTSSSDAQREAFKALAASAGGAEIEPFRKGDNSIKIGGLNAHQEYGFYVAADDKLGTTGNFTIFSRKDGADPAAPNEPNGGQMLKTAYTDGKAPEIQEVISRKGELTQASSEFIITFSEAIMRQKGDSNLADYNKPKGFTLGEILTITDENGVNITSQYEIAEDYVAGISTTATDKASSLKIKLKSPILAAANRSINVKLNENKSVVYDYVGRNGVNTAKNLGKYVYPAAIASKLLDAVLTGYNIGTIQVPASKTMRVITELDIDLTLNQKYYYAVTSSSRTSVDPQLVLNLVSDSNTPNNDILTYGSGVLQTNSPADKQFVLNLNAPPASAGYNPVFTRGNHIFIFTIDKYGNIVWATDTGNKYRSISNDLNIPLN